MIIALKCVLWIEINHIGIKGEVVHFGKVLEILECDSDKNGLAMNKIACLEKLAQSIYEKNPLGVENIKFTFYLQDIKDRDAGITDDEFKQAVKILVDTEKFIQEYDIEIAEYNGTNYNDEKYNIERIGKTIEELNGTEYDFATLESYEEMHANVDRKRCLASIFYRICGQEEDNQGRHKAILRYCNKISAHSLYIQPLNNGGEMVVDPLILLQLHEMRCGQVARIACDLFSAAGYQNRLVQLGGHVIAEIYYDGEWHYFDADLWNGNETVEKPGGGYSVGRRIISSPLLDRQACQYWL